MTDLIGAIFILLGSCITALATWGIVKFDDVFLRMHAASKSASFGVVLMLIGTMFVFPEYGIVLKLMFAVFLIFLKTPVASQAIARAAYFHFQFKTDPDLGEQQMIKPKGKDELRLLLDEWHPEPDKKSKGKKQK